jgi:tRNA uridine 5-carboxymethylaminomethyl modification enzyme
MWSPRAQCDRMLYSSVMRSCLENTKNLHIWQDQVISLLFQNDIFLAFV